MRILIIEDDSDIAANLYDYLENRGHAVDAAPDGITGLHLATTQDWDAILLDLALPGMSGLKLCQKLREEAQRDTPVLMLTARDTLEDKIEGFTNGADDYLVKPFALREVEVRLFALNKRHNRKVTQTVLRVGDIVLDTKTLTVERGGQVIKLPPKCLRMLELLMQSPDQVFSRAEIETAVWGETQADSDTLRTHIYALRRALAAHGAKDAIETIHGQGYRLVASHAN